jgi:hypothetical protein
MTEYEAEQVAESWASDDEIDTSLGMRLRSGRNL